MMTPVAPKRATRDPMRAAVSAMAFETYLIGLRCALPPALQAFPLPALLRWMAGRKGSSYVSAAYATKAIARSEAIARWLHAPDTCLFRAAVRFAGLHATGVSATFVMGVRADAPEIGHAWVELDGVPLGELVDPKYVPTFRFAGEPAS